ncbi:MAG: DoxX family protein, partial [Propionicimonas sp.]
RDAALAAAAPAPVVAPEPVVIKQRTNDKFFGSLGLFLLRLVVAGIFGLRGYQMLGDLAATQERFASTLLAPYAQILAVVVGSIHLAIALALILGALTRVAGLGVALVAGGALAFVWWGPWSPFVAGQPGFLGELELLLAVVGLLLLFVGGGGWSIDRSFRSARAKDKAARQLAP